MEHRTYQNIQDIVLVVVAQNKNTLQYASSRLQIKRLHNKIPK